MKYFFLFILVFVTVTLQLKCQTATLEINNLSQKFENKELDIYTYQKQAKVWRDVIEKYGYPKIPYDSGSSKFRYEFIYEFDSLDKEIIYNRILEYISINFDFLSNIVDYQDYNLGKIILKIKNTYNKNGEKTTNFSSTFRITVVGNRVRFEAFNLGFEYLYDTYDNGSYILFNYSQYRPVEDFFPITNNFYKKWDETMLPLHVLDKYIRETIYNMKIFIGNYQNDYEF
jgi:hypothetical protein